MNLGLHKKLEAGDYAGVMAALDDASTLQEALETRNVAGDSLMHLAASLGFNDVLERLLNGLAEEKRGQRGSKGRTVVHCALQSEFLDTAELAVRCMPKDALGVVDDSGATGLTLALRMKAHDLAKQMIAQASPAALSQADRTNRTPLYYAVTSGFEDLAVEILASCDSESLLLHPTTGSHLVHVTLVRNMTAAFEVLCNRLPASSLAEVDPSGNDCLTLALTHASSPNAIHILKRLPDTDLKRVYKNKQTALHHAASRGHFAAAKELIQRVPSLLSVRGVNGQTPLLLALRGGHEDVALLCIHAMSPKQLQVSDSDGVSPLMEAASRSLPAAQALLKAVPSAHITKQCSDLRMALHFAVQSKKEGLIVLLAAATPKEKLLVTNRDKHTPFNLGARSNISHETLLLLYPGVPIHPQKDKCSDPLHDALTKQKVDLSLFLIPLMDESAFLPVKKESYVTLAAVHDTEVLRQLVARSPHSALLAYKEDSGHSPLMSALEKKEENAMVLMESLEPEDLLLQDPIAYRACALHFAARFSRLEAMAAMIDRLEPEAINAKDINGHSPLWVAVHCGQVEMAEMLLEVTDDEMLLERDGEGNSILQVATKHAMKTGSLKLLADFLDRLPESEIVRTAGNNYMGRDTPFHLAVNSMVAPYLLQRITDDELLLEVDNRDDTPLHCAVEHGDHLLAEELLRRCPSAKARKNSRLRTPAEMAKGTKMEVLFHSRVKGAM